MGKAWKFNVHEYVVWPGARTIFSGTSYGTEKIKGDLNLRNTGPIGDLKAAE